MKIELRNKTNKFNVFDCLGGLWTHIIIIEVKKKSFSVIVSTATKSFTAKKGGYNFTGLWKESVIYSFSGNTIQWKSQQIDKSTSSFVVVAKYQKKASKKKNTWTWKHFLFFLFFFFYNTVKVITVPWMEKRYVSNSIESCNNAMDCFFLLGC